MVSDASIEREVSRGEKALEKFEMVAHRLLKRDPPSRENSRDNSWDSADGAWTSRSLQTILSGWESRIRFLVDAATKMASDVTADEMDTAKVAVNFILSDQKVTPTGQHPREYYGRIVQERTIFSFYPSVAGAGPGPFVKWEAFVSVAAQKIHDILATTATKPHLDNVDDNAPNRLAS